MTGTAMSESPPRTDDAANQSPPDHANVVVHPPVLWVLLVAAGYGLDFLLPLPFFTRWRARKRHSPRTRRLLRVHNERE